MAEKKNDSKKRGNTTRKGAREPGFFSDYGGSGIIVTYRPKKGGKK